MRPFPTEQDSPGLAPLDGKQAVGRDDSQQPVRLAAAKERDRNLLVSGT